MNLPARTLTSYGVEFTNDESIDSLTSQEYNRVSDDYDFGDEDPEIINNLAHDALEEDLHYAAYRGLEDITNISFGAGKRRIMDSDDDFHDTTARRAERVEASSNPKRNRGRKMQSSGRH